MIQILGWFGLTSIAIAAVPQTYLMVRRGHGEGVSWPYMLFLWSGFLCMAIFAKSTNVGWALVLNYAIQWALFSVMILVKLFPRKAEDANNPTAVGLRIRALLLGLRAKGYSEKDERCGIICRATDRLRSGALSVSGICSLESGEIAPACTCGWSPETGIVRSTSEEPLPSGWEE